MSRRRRGCRGRAAPTGRCRRAGGDVADVDVAVPRGVTAELVEVELPVAANLEVVRGQPRDGEVAADAARARRGAGSTTTVPTGRSTRLVVSRSRKAQAPGPVTSSRLREVMSYRPAPLAGRERFRTSDRRPEHAAQPFAPRELVRRAGPRSHSYQCGRSQPLASRKYAPSSCSPVVEREVPQRPGCSMRLQRVDDVVDLDVVLGASVLDVGRAWAGGPRSG